MKRTVVTSLVLLVLVAGSALADPGVDVRYENEMLRVTLNGSYAGRYYQVWRSDQRIGQYDPMVNDYTLCTGDCFLTDLEATPGRTYYYRFVLQSSGGLVEYGPYAVTVPDTPVGVRVAPNPFDGEARVVLSVPGSRRREAPVEAHARVLDLQGRTVRTLLAGSLPRGETTVFWNGRGDHGEPLGSGVYFVHLRTPLGSTISRIVRVR